MAAKKRAVQIGGVWQFSWRNFLIAASIVLNIAFVVLFITMTGTNKLDIMFIQEGVNRYCKVENDMLFDGSSDQMQALRRFTCAKGDAKEPFQRAFNEYLRTQNIEPTN
ncbi:MAG TPA: hypothetical protein VFT87_04460 [Candidatus Saccharimonadales bacterium]|nr:hypothetical protein [Candidatus Saccharimonadales bacterium]